MRIKVRYETHTEDPNGKPLLIQPGKTGNVKDEKARALVRDGFAWAEKTPSVEDLQKAAGGDPDAARAEQEAKLAEIAAEAAKKAEAEEQAKADRKAAAEAAKAAKKAEATKSGKGNKGLLD